MDCTEKWDEIYFDLMDYLNSKGFYVQQGDFLLNEGVLKVDCSTNSPETYLLDVKKSYRPDRFRAKNNKKNREILLNTIKEKHTTTKELKLSVYTHNNTIVEIEYLISL